MNIRDKLNDITMKIGAKLEGGLSQAETDRSSVEPVITPGMPELLREAAAEGAVLLKNDGVLPLKSGTRVSLFGITAEEWHYVGYGSGGDVNYPYRISLTDAVRACEDLNLNEDLAKIYEGWNNEHPINHGYWGHWPFYFREMPLNDEVVTAARNFADTAIVTIGRSSGEDRDCQLKKGSYYLADDERAMLDAVTARFQQVIVLLNIGNIIDMSWVDDYGDKIGAILIPWQGGMESGNAVVDLLCGKKTPCGRLTDSIAYGYDDYPSSGSFGYKDFNVYGEDIFVGYRYFETFNKSLVRYPFGYGLSYTQFKTKSVKEKEVDGGFRFRVRVENIGSYPGKHIVQLYLSKPCDRLGNPAYELCAFAKTGTLMPGEQQEIDLFVDMYQLCSYDDSGSTNHAGAYVIEGGEYAFCLGDDVRSLEKIHKYHQEKTVVYAQHKQAAAPIENFEIIHAENISGNVHIKMKNAPKRKFDLGCRITNNLPPIIPQTGDRGIKFEDVKNGSATIEAFVAQLSLGELEAITRGDYEMNSPLGALGNAGAYGGVLQSLRDKGIPAKITTDGPSGIRLTASCSLLPIGTLLACSFDIDLCYRVYSAVSAEMKEKGTDVLLAPGMNIHRNPLCGRNFEYFSEDPYLTGKIAAAVVKGIQSEGVSACPKHFACNNQEYRRNMSDSRLTERALREIYLKGFEICVKEAKPRCIMTSYNKVNGVYSHYNYDLCTTVLRGEWGYDGTVMTDWWMKKAKSPEFPNMCDQAYRIRAQVDLLMPGGDRVTNRKPDGTLLKTYGLPDGITLGEMQRCAINVLKSC